MTLMSGPRRTSTRRVTIDGYAVVAPGHTGRSMRPAWVVKGIGSSDTPQAWRDAAEHQVVGAIDAPTLLRQNPEWKTVDCKITVSFEVPDVQEHGQAGGEA